LSGYDNEDLNDDFNADSEIEPDEDEVIIINFLFFFFKILK